MVQGGLLMVHPGSIHGGGEAPGGGSSLRQGAGKRSSSAPDLGSTAAAEQRRDREKGFPSRGFHVTRIIWAKGGSQGGTRGPGGPLAQPHPRARREGAWGPGGSPLAPSVIPEASSTLIFYWIFPNFWSTFNMGET